MTAECSDSEGCERHGLDEYLDGELDSAREPSLFDHLIGCRICREHINALLAVRRLAREETIAVPAWADDAVFLRTAMLRRGRARTSALHSLEPLWARRMTFSLRSLLLAIGGILAALGIMLGQVEPGPGYVVYEQEAVHIDDGRSAGATPIYVLYPGIVVEGER